MDSLANLPWYTYVVLGLAVAGYIYRYFIKTTDDDLNLFVGKFKNSPENALTGDQLFSVSFDVVLSNWWKVPINTLAFEKVRNFDNFMKGWGIDTKEGYWALTEYFMQDGRRWYFDFIFNMINTAPEAEWDTLMEQKFGPNERAQRYFRLLKTKEVLNRLKQKGFVIFDSEIEKGVAAYDSAILVGQARRAYSANLITEEEAWKVIGFATQLAKDNFSSWEEFGKSYVLGFSLDTPDSHKDYRKEVYHQFKQAVESEKSPWNQLNWPS